MSRRFRYKKEHFWLEVPFAELNLLLMGQHQQHNSQFLCTNWISDSRGFRLEERISAPIGYKGKLNPRLTGRVEFLNPENKELLASEGIVCTVQQRQFEELPGGSQALLHQR